MCGNLHEIEASHLWYHLSEIPVPIKLNWEILEFVNCLNYNKTPELITQEICAKESGHYLLCNTRFYLIEDGNLVCFDVETELGTLGLLGKHSVIELYVSLAPVCMICSFCVYMYICT